MNNEAAARGEQDRLRPLVEWHGAGPAVGSGTVAGVDVAYDDGRNLVAAAAVLLDATTRTPLETVTAVGEVTFPYVPGLLAFRELPSVLETLEKLSTVPDLVVCDGYGVAHPRRLGLASHLGVVTGLTTIGVAKNPFLYTAEEPGPERGARTPLMDGAEPVGCALRTRAGVKPVYVSTGHRIGLSEACEHVLYLCPRYRIPETTRLADRACRDALKDLRSAAG